MIPCDFLAPVESQNPIEGGVHHQVLYFYSSSQADPVL